MPLVIYRRSGLMMATFVLKLYEPMNGRVIGFCKCGPGYFSNQHLPAFIFPVTAINHLYRIVIDNN